MLLGTSLLLIACSTGPGDAFAPQDTGTVPRPVPAVTVAALTPSRDGHITATHPNRNSGAKDSMDVAQPLRTLVAFDQAAIVAAVGAGPLRSAKLRFAIGRAADNWGPNGRTVDVHRMLVPWTEAGFTWNCANDAVPGNTAKDCTGIDSWDMTTPAPGLWQAARTGQVLVTNGMSGVVEFDVTADVAAFLAGAPNEGWVIKKTNEERQGRLVLLARESASPPHLIIELADVPWPLLTTSFPAWDTTKIVELSPGGSAYLRTDARLVFVPGTSDVDKRALMLQFGLTVLGVTPGGVHFVHFPDPGPTISDYRAFSDEVNNDPRVEAFAPIPASQRITRYARLLFVAGTTDADKRAFIAAHGMTVLGATPGGVHFVRIPDPGPTPADYEAFADRVRADSRIAAFAPLTFGQPNAQADAPYPDWPILGGDTYPTLDATKTTELRPGGARYYRANSLLGFKASTTVTERRDLVQSFGMKVLGVTRAGNHFVSFPDPGESIQDYRAFADRVRADPRVLYFAPIVFGGEPGELNTGETAWPILTTQLPVLDTTRTVELAPGGRRYYRSNATVSFVPGTPDSDKRVILNRFSMAVIGVTLAGNFYVSFPDPGPTIADYRAFAEKVHTDPRVRAFAPLSFGAPDTYLDTSPDE